MQHVFSDYYDAVVYLDLINGTYLNVNLWLVKLEYAVIRDYPNAFDPRNWTLYVHFGERQTATLECVGGWSCVYVPLLLISLFLVTSALWFYLSRLSREL